jgi:hypothetical protein
MTTCLTCGFSLSDGEHCERCGPERKDATVTPAGFACTVTLGVPATIGEQNLPGQRGLQVNSGQGTQSFARITNDEVVSVNAHGRPDIGRRSEARVTDILLDCLRSVGHAVTVVEGHRDDHGEDGLLLLDGREFTLQITAIVPSSEFWRASAKGSGEVSATIAEATGWIYDAILRKTTTIAEPQRNAIVLAIDARHLGVLAAVPVREAFTKSYGSAQQFGFRDLWLVGPLLAHSARLP